MQQMKMSLFMGLRRLCFLVNNLDIINKKVILQRATVPLLNSGIKIHTSALKYDLMEFFDDKENWGEREVSVGRSWRVEELRIKSNSDLHKLWYVLLKERNMLMTMEHEYNAHYAAFPNPERIDKVEESMRNLENVVRERNRAYYELETGQSGERPVGEDTNCFGLSYKFKMKEYIVPKRMNKEYLRVYKINNETDDHVYVKNFLARLEEKKRKLAWYRKKKRHYAVCQILKMFPNVDEEALKEQFPDIDLEEAKKDRLSRGHTEYQY